MILIQCDTPVSAQEWYCRLINSAYNGDPNECTETVPKKKVLALLNPFGGMGLAPRKWEKARQILDLAHLDVTLQQTERQGHAYDILKDELIPGQYDGILTISGDGLIHESINGAMHRADREEFLENLAFGFIPAGTGNGLHKSVVETFNEKDGIHSAAFAVAKGRTSKMDLTELDLEYNEKKVYMFLLMAWAVVSDCDINSEVIRCCGPPRFTVWGVYRVLSVRHYAGDLQYDGYECENNEEEQKRDIENHETKETYKILSVINTPWISTDLNAAPLSKIDDGVNDIILMTANKSRFQMAKALIAFDTGDYFDKNGDISANLGLDYKKAATWSLKPNRKGPVPENSEYRLPEGTETFENEIFTIDGEKYPAQNVKGKVLQKVLRIYY